MPIISFTSWKGGVGKTFLTVNAAVYLASKGKKVLLVDGSRSGDAELMLGIKAEKTLYDVVLGSCSLSDVVSEKYGVSVLPIGFSLEAQRRVSWKAIYKSVKELSDKYELILVDTPPIVAGLVSRREALGSLVVGDFFYIVTTPAKTALMNALKTKMLLEKIGKKVSGVIVNRWRASLLSKPYYRPSEIEAFLKAKISAIIPEDKNVMRSINASKPLVLKPSSPAARAIVKFCDSFLLSY